MSKHGILFWVASAAIFALTAAPALAQYRVYQSLDADKSTGIWTFTPLLQYNQDNGAGKTAVTPTAPGPITVPSYWSDCNPDWDDDWAPTTSARNHWIEKADYTRTFNIPASMAGKRIKLRFGDVGHSCEVRVNNTLVGAKHYQGTVPFEYDITTLVSAPSTNNALKATVWDHNDLREPTDTTKYAYPFGHLIDADKMSGIAQDVTLYAVPKVYVKDVYVVTTVSNMQIRIEATVANEDTVGRTVSLENDLMEITQLNPELTTLAHTLNQAGTTTIAAGAQQTVVLTGVWSDAKLWWPHNPQLYRMRTRVKESGATLDEKTDTRFGFREFKIDPTPPTASRPARYNLNGLPFHGRGNTINAMLSNIMGSRPALEYLIDQYKAFGCNLIRHGAAIPPAPVYFDVCDEKGMLCIEEMYYNGQNLDAAPAWPNISRGVLNVKNATFEQHVDEMARAIVMRDRNHPSIVIWNIENEIFYGKNIQLPSNIGRVRGVIESLDLTRPVGCDHEGSLNGLLAIKNKHYPGSVDNLNDDFSAKYMGDWYPQYSGLDIYYAMAANPPTVPFGIGEFHWLKNAAPDSWWSMYNPYHWNRLRAYMLRGYRLFGASDIRPFVLEHGPLNTIWIGPRSTRNSHMPMRKSYSAVAVFDHAYDAIDPITLHGGTTPVYNWVSVNEGSSNTRRYDVYNDDLEDTATDITVKWEVRLFDQVTDSGSTVVTVPLSEWRNINLTWTAPQVNADTNFLVVVEAIKGGRSRFTDYRIFKSVNAGGSTVANPPQTYRNSFDRVTQSGFREHDTFWTVANGVYSQPSIYGLNVGYRPWRNESTGQIVWPYTGPFSVNNHTSALEAWTFGNFNAAFDVKITQFDESVIWDPWAGMGFRLRYPEDNPGGWDDTDTSHISGYFAGIRRLTSTAQYQAFIAYTTTTWPFFYVAASTPNLTLPADGIFRLEVTASGSALTAKVNNSRGISWTDPSALYSSGFASLNTSFRTAGQFDNVQIGPAPFAPWWSAANPTQGVPGSPLMLAWTAATGATEYLIEWSADGFATVGGTSGWVTGTEYTFPSPSAGVLKFRIYSRDANQQQSAPSWDWNVQLGEVAPVADFSASPVSGQAALGVDFTDLSNYAPTSWAWDVNGDNTIDSTEQNPHVVYYLPGTYTVKLTATNGVGSDTKTRTGYITVTSKPMTAASRWMLFE